MMYDVSTLCVHKHYVTAYCSHEMSMDEMMEKGVCVGGGGGGEAHGILGNGFWNEGVGKEKIIPNNKGVGFQKFHVGKLNSP